jgi:hypothetical protein
VAEGIEPSVEALAKTKIMLSISINDALGLDAQRCPPLAARESAARFDINQHI